MVVVMGLEYIIVDDKGTNAKKFLDKFKQGYGIIFAHPTSNAIHYCIQPPEDDSKPKIFKLDPNPPPPLIPPNMTGREPRR